MVYRFLYILLHNLISTQASALRIVPASVHKSASINDTANSLGLHDTLQYGPRSLAAEVKSEGTLKDRLENVSVLLFQCSIGSPYYQWEATQDNLKLTLERNLFGMHAPMRRLMERKIVANVRCIEFAPTLILADNYKTPMYGAPHSNLHLDILMGRDEIIEPSDVLLGDALHYIKKLIGSSFLHVGMETGPSLDPHNEMQRKVHKDKM